MERPNQEPVIPANGSLGRPRSVTEHEVVPSTGLSVGDRRRERATIPSGRSIDVDAVHERRTEIKLVVKIVVDPGFDPRTTDDERKPTGLVVGRHVVAVDVEFAEVLAVVSGEYDQRLLTNALLLEKGEQTIEVVVHVTDAGVVPINELTKIPPGRDRFGHPLVRFGGMSPFGP